MINYIEKIGNIVFTYLEDSYVSSIIQENNDKILFFIKKIHNEYPDLNLVNASNFIYGDRCWKIYIDSNEPSNNIYILLISIFGYFTVMEEKKTDYKHSIYGIDFNNVDLNSYEPITIDPTLIEENKLIDKETCPFLDTLFNLVKKIMPSIEWIPKHLLKKNVKQLGIATKNETIGETIVFDMLFYDYFSNLRLLKGS